MGETGHAKLPGGFGAVIRHQGGAVGLCDPGWELAEQGEQPPSLLPQAGGVPGQIERPVQ